VQGLQLYGSFMVIWELASIVSLKNENFNNNNAYQIGLGWRFSSIQFSSQNKSEFSKSSNVPQIFVQH